MWAPPFPHKKLLTFSYKPKQELELVREQADDERTQTEEPEAVREVIV